MSSNRDELNVPQQSQNDQKLQEYRDRNSCWSIVAIIFSIIGIAGLIIAISMGQYTNIAGIVQTAGWFFWWRSSSFAVDAVDRRDYTLIPKALDNISYALYILWFEIIMVSVFILIVLVVLISGQDFLEIGDSFEMTFGMILAFLIIGFAVQLFFLLKAKSIESDGEELCEILGINKKDSNYQRLKGGDEDLENKN